MTHNPIKSQVKSDTTKLLYIIGSYPNLTTTFIDREINILREWGADIQIVSIRQPNSALSIQKTELQKGTIYLLPSHKLSLLAAHLRFALLRPWVYFGMLFFLLTRPHPNQYHRGMTFIHFGMGVYAAYLLRHHTFKQIHAHFVDRATTVAMVVSRLLNVPYSATAHANDIYVNPILLPEKIAKAKFIVTCTGYNKTHLNKIGNGAFHEKIHLIYHGLDIDNYIPENRQVGDTPVLIGVGQLKEKKGFTYLLKACRILKDQGYDFRCQIVGEGPLREALETQIRELSLEDTITLCGALPHRGVVEKYKEASLFVLPCVVSVDGDRDGIPNVILEAMTMELPIVSTRHSGIPEVVKDDENGLLVPPEDEVALAQALSKLLDSSEYRQQLGHKARQTVVENFTVRQNVDRLLTEFITE